MLSLVKRDFMAIPYRTYLAFLLLPFPLFLLDFHILFTSVIITITFWAMIYGMERHRKAERFFLSLPVSRLMIVQTRYMTAFIMLFLMIGYSYLLTIVIFHWDESKSIIIVPDGVTLYIMICLAVIFVSLILPNSYLYKSYVMPVLILAVQLIIFILLSSELFVSYTLNTNISYDTGDESLLFTYERGPWVTELIGMIEYYLPSYSLVWLTLITIIVFAGSFSLSYFAYRRQNVG